MVNIYGTGSLTLAGLLLFGAGAQFMFPEPQRIPDP
jgi:hypothetical protein